MARWFKKVESPIKQFAHSSALKPEQRGIYAEQALSNPVILEAFADIEKRLMTQWHSTLDDQTDVREITFDRIKALEYIKQALTGYANEALLEREEQKRKEEEKQWMQNQA